MLLQCWGPMLVQHWDQGCYNIGGNVPTMFWTNFTTMLLQRCVSTLLKHWGPMLLQRWRPTMPEHSPNDGLHYWGVTVFIIGE